MDLHFIRKCTILCFSMLLILACSGGSNEGNTQPESIAGGTLSNPTILSLSLKNEISGNSSFNYYKYIAREGEYISIHATLDSFTDRSIQQCLQQTRNGYIRMSDISPSALDGSDKYSCDRNYTFQFPKNGTYYFFFEFPYDAVGYFNASVIPATGKLFSDINNASTNTLYTSNAQIIQHDNTLVVIDTGSILINDVDVGLSTLANAGDIIKLKKLSGSGLGDQVIVNVQVGEIKQQFVINNILNSISSGYEATVFGFVPSGFSLSGRGMGINFSGVIAGQLQANGKSNAATLAPPFNINTTNIISEANNGDYSFATDLNENNQITGYYNTGIGHHAFISDINGFTDLGTLGGTNSDPKDISESGNVTGESLTLSGDRHAFLWDGNSIIDINDNASRSGGMGVSDNGNVTGWATFNGENHAFLWNGIDSIDLGVMNGDSYSEGSAVNNSGQVTGSSENHAFLWDGAVMHDLGTLGGRAAGIGINELGHVTGLFETGQADSISHAFVWKNGEMIDLDPNNIYYYSQGWKIDEEGNVLGIAGDGVNSYLIKWSLIGNN